MKRAIISGIALTIVIGVLALAFNNAFGNQTIMFLTKQQININNDHFYIWKFDFWQYIQNIQLTTSNMSVLIFDMPTRAWQDMNVLDWWVPLGNNMLVILDYVIMIINLLLYPLKVGSYLLQNVMAIMGINTDTSNVNNGLAWLVVFVRDILSNIVIPYI